MSYGFRAANANGIVNIDEDSVSYVYLGKQVLTGEVTISCVGYPLIFFELPYNVTNNTSNDGRYYDIKNVAGVAMKRLRPHPSTPNTWIATFFTTILSTMYIRVFGKLHLNFPNGAGQSYGARAWNSQGQLIFDTGCRQLRLTGNTYDTEILINSRFPPNYGAATNGDTALGMPFNLAGKSIMANTRGTIRVPYATGTFFDPGIGRDVYTYDYPEIESIFSASGNTLYSRKSYANSSTFERPGDQITVVQYDINFYTRVALIDNNLFP